MTDKTTSPEIASIAGAIVSKGDPFDDMDIRTKIASTISEGIDAHSFTGSAQIRVPSKLIDDIHAILKPWFDDAIAVAASALGQAEGESTDCDR